MKYVLILRDDFSSYVWLYPTENATIGAATEAVATWCASFGTFDWLVTDQGAHLKNQLMRLLESEMNLSHHFTTPYCPSTKGSVARVCREVFRVCRALTSDWKLSQYDWTAVTECIQIVINHSPLKRLRLREKGKSSVYRTPLEVFTCLKPTRPLLRALPVRKYQ